jgi:hypothetical protein
MANEKHEGASNKEIREQVAHDKLAAVGVWGGHVFLNSARVLLHKTMSNRRNRAIWVA